MAESHRLVSMVLTTTTETHNLTAASMISVIDMIDRLDPEDPDAIALRESLDRLGPLPLQQPFGSVECDHYAEHGWVIVPGLFDGWTEPVRKAAMTAFSTHDPSRDRPFEPLSGRSLRDDWTPETDPVIGASTRFGPSSVVARRLIGDDGTLTLRGTVLFLKEPPLAYGSPWHTDTHDLPTIDEHGVNVWIPLDDADADSGAIQLVADSHRFSEARRFELRDAAAIRRIEAGETPDLSHPIPGLIPGDYELIAPTFKAGDALVLDSAMIHGAAGNLSDHSVAAISTLWYAPR